MIAHLPQCGSVRAEIATATQASHTDLHKDPLLSLLSDPRVDEPTYFGSLQVFQTFFHAVEAERRCHACWPLLSLQLDCSALDCDVGGLPHQLTQLAFTTPQELLGGLYVAHGAAFGRATFKRNILTALPLASHRFIECRQSKVSWRLLTNQMQFEGNTPTGKAELLAGATRSFETVRQLSAQALRRIKNGST